MTLLVVAMTLLLPSLCWLLANNLEQLTTQWKQSNHVYVYLQPGSSSLQQASLLAKVKQLPGVADIVLKSPEQGLAELQANQGWLILVNIWQAIPCRLCLISRRPCNLHIRSNWRNCLIR